jgi:hypothetical protein
MNVNELFAQQQSIEADLKAATAVVNRLKGDVSCSMGLTPDSVKNSPEYKAAKAELDRQFKRLQNFNIANKKHHREFLNLYRIQRNSRRAVV